MLPGGVLASQIIHKNQTTRKNQKIKSRLRWISKMRDGPIHWIIQKNHLETVHVSLIFIWQGILVMLMKTAGQKNQNIKWQKITIGNDTGINLFTNIQYDEMKVLVSESFHCALLDSGCTQTVCGESWYNCYKENLTKGEASLMKELT